MKHKPVLSLVLLAALGGFAGTASASADLAKKLNCVGCHTPDKKLVGPSYKDIAAKFPPGKPAPGHFLLFCLLLMDSRACRTLCLPSAAWLALDAHPRFCFFISGRRGTCVASPIALEFSQHPHLQPFDHP